jgi:hypothetical protein
VADFGATASALMKNASHIDDLLQPLIMTNHYLSIRNQIPTFHAGGIYK